MTDIIETWKQVIVDGQSLAYDISNHGNIKKGQAVCKLNKKPDQPIRYKLNLGDEKIKLTCIHILVATAFLENPNNYTCVKHKNGNVHDNRIENLEWVSNTILIKKSHDKPRVYRGEPIEQYSIDGKTFIKRFESIHLAATELDILETNFHSVLSGKTKTIGGFHFKYASKNTSAMEEDGFEIIKNYENYMINREGKVYHIKQQVIIEPKVTGNLQFVYINRKRVFIHILVATQFIDNPDNLTHVIHKDGDKFNNNADNLKWV